MNTYIQLVTKAEQAREQGNYLAALQYIDQAIIMAAEALAYGDVVEALAHKLLIYLHRYQENGNAVFLELMYGDVQAGIKIVDQHNIEGHPKAVMYLRAGNYFYEHSQLSESVQLLQHAIDALPNETSTGTKAEFMSHYGMLLVLTGVVDKGLRLLQQAMELAEQDSALPPYHKQIVIAGIHMRMAEAYHTLPQNDQVQIHVEAAEAIAQSLANEHSMPMRLMQIKRLKEKLTK